MAEFFARITTTYDVALTVRVTAATQEEAQTRLEAGQFNQVVVESEDDKTWVQTHTVEFIEE